MAKKKAGKTDQAPEQETVEVHDAESLTQIIRDQMEVEEPPKEEKTPDEPSAEVEGEEGEEVLSQDEDAAEVEPAAEDELGEPEGEPEPEPEAEKDELPKGVRKRIDKLTAQKKAIAEEKDSEITKLREQVNGLLEKVDRGEAESQPDRAPDSENPYRHLTSAEDIRREELSAEAVMDWCEDNPDGAVVADGEKEREYTAEDVRGIRKRARKALSRQLPDQKEWAKSYHAVDGYADDAFPWWQDKTTSEYQAAVQVFKVFPEVQKFSDYKVNIGDMIEGRKLRLNREAQTAKGKKKTAPPRAPEQPMAPVAEPAPINQKTARSASARKAFSDTGNIDDLARIMVAELD
jgi:hypothetical protein